MTTPVTPADLSALRALAEAATPGPWRIEHLSEDPESNATLEPNVIWLGTVGDGCDVDPADAAFIAAARTAVPSLLAHVSAQAERIEALEAFAKEWADEECCYGDGCPTFGGTRHGTCTPCKARRVLGGKEGT